MRDFMLRKTGVTAAKAGNKDRLGNLILRQISQSGLYQNEKWGDAPVNWTGPSASFRFVPAGGKVIVPIHIGHPDVSAKNPVRVGLAIEGSPRRETQRTFTRKGYATIEVDLHDLHAGPLKMTIAVNRTFSTPTDPRSLGVAVHNLRFE